MPFLCLPRPTLEQAQQRKWYLIIITTIENIFFSALLFGWAALLYVIKDQGFYFHLCEDGHGDNHTHHGNETSNETSTGAYEAHPHHLMRRLLSGGGLSDGTGCSEQETTLNLAYTIALFATTASTFVTGSLQDKYGYKPVRLGACLMFILSCVLLGACTADNLTLFIPGLVLNGIAGMAIAFTSMQMANLFGNIRGTVLGVIVGSFSSAAIVFPLFKTCYDYGAPISALWIFLACGGVFMFLNCLFTWPGEIIPIPAELQNRIYFEQLSLSPKKDGKDIFERVKSSGKRMSDGKTFLYHNIYTSRQDLVADSGEETHTSFMRIVFSPTFMLGLLFLAITFLRVLLYIGSMHIELLNITDDVGQVSSYINMFGYLQILCLPACPIFNIILDRGVSMRPTEGEDEEEFKFRMKIQKLKNCCMCFVFNNCILLLFGTIILIPNLQIQVITFIAHTIIRGTCQAAALGMFAACFPFQYLGKLLGLNTLMSAVVDLVQAPLFITIEVTLQGDPTKIDIALLGISFLTFCLPIYMFFHIKGLQRGRANNKKAISNGDVKKLIDKGDPYAVQHMNKSAKEAFV